MVFCALQTAGSPGISWVQTIGGLVVVFALLLLSLRLLGRFNRRHTAGKAQVLAAWPMGPKREMQVVKLLDTVHYLYKCEGSLVELKQQSLAEYQAALQHEGNLEAKQTLKSLQAQAS